MPPSKKPTRPTRIKPKRTVRFKKSWNPLSRQRWRFQVVAENGEIVSISETFMRLSDAKKEAENQANTDMDHRNVNRHVEGYGQPHVEG